MKGRKVFSQMESQGEGSMVPQLAFLKKRESAEVKGYDVIAVGLAGSRGSDTRS